MIRPTHIQLASGAYFDLTDPAGSDLDLRDIAHALAHTCRFGGHTREFYSVAEHSVRLAQLLRRDPLLAWIALWHDAADAYLGDIPLPLKALLPDYQLLEHQVEQVIWPRLGLPRTLPDAVLHGGLVMLATERRDLLPATGEAWPHLIGVTPRPRAIRPWDSAYSRRTFLQYIEILWRDLCQAPKHQPVVARIAPLIGPAIASFWG